MARRVSGVVAIVLGVGWIGFMLYDFACIQLGPVPSADAALAIWYPIAGATFPIASTAIGAGWMMIFGWHGGRNHQSTGARGQD